MFQTRHLGIIIIIQILLISQFSCKSLMKKAFQQPIVKVEKVQVEEISFAGADLNITISIDNPNAIGITLNRLEYELFIEDERLIEGIKSDKLQIAARKKSEFTIPVQLHFKGLQDGIYGILNKDKISYEFKSLITINTPITDLTFQPGKKGNIPIPERPRFNVEKIDTNFSFSEVEIDFYINISNNDDVKLDIKKMVYQIQINGTPISNSTMTIQKTLTNRNEKLTYKIPVSIKLLNMKRSLISAIKNGQFNYSFDMNMELNSKYGPYKIPYKIEKSYQMY